MTFLRQILLSRVPKLNHCEAKGYGETLLGDCKHTRAAAEYFLTPKILKGGEYSGFHRTKPQLPFYSSSRHSELLLQYDRHHRLREILAQLQPRGEGGVSIV